MQTRKIWLDGRGHPPAYAPHTFMGFSTGEWFGDTLTVTTTHIKKEFYRRSGIPSSDRTTVVEHYVRHGDLLSQVMIISDPVYLTEPYVNTQEFLLMDRGNQNWLYNCEYVMEVPQPRHQVPHFLPGENPFLEDFSRKFGLPFPAVFAGADSTYPEYMETIEENDERYRTMTGMKRKKPPVARRISVLLAVLLGSSASAPARQAPIEPFHVQGNVYLLPGAASNVVVQIGDDGILVVDTGGRETSGAVLAAIRELSDGPIRWIVNTHAHLDHTGGNETVSQAGMTLNGNPAAIIANENVPARMVAEDRPITEWPLNTFFEDRRDFHFNDEAVMLYHYPRGHTDGDVIVYFRGSDVLVAGDLFITTTYPVIDLSYAGGVDGFIDGMNTMLDVAVPKWLQEGGTFVIPGHGRVGDEADIIEYRDMVVIVRDRIEAMIARGLTLEQVKAAQPTLDYDLRYGEDSGPWTTEMFVEAVYTDLQEAPMTTKTTLLRSARVAVAVTGILLLGTPAALAQRGDQPSAQTAAPVDFTGNWVSVVSEDWRHRMLTPRRGDFESLPLNAAGREAGNAWDLAADNAAGLECKAFGVGGIIRQPGRVRVEWEDENTLRLDFDAGTQTRLLHFDPTAETPDEPTWQGHSNGRMGDAPRRPRWNHTSPDRKQHGPDRARRGRSRSARRSGPFGCAHRRRIPDGGNDWFSRGVPPEERRTLQRTRIDNRILPQVAPAPERRQLDARDHRHRRSDLPDPALLHEHTFQAGSRRSKLQPDAMPDPGPAARGRCALISFKSSSTEGRSAGPVPTWRYRTMPSGPMMTSPPN